MSSGNSPHSGRASSPSTPPPIHTNSHINIAAGINSSATGKDGDSSPSITPSGSHFQPGHVPAFQPLRPRSSSNLSNSARRSLSPQVGLGQNAVVRAVIGFTGGVAVEPPFEWEGAVKEVESVEAAVQAAFELAKGEPAVVRNLSRLTSTLPGASLFPPTLVMGGTTTGLSLATVSATNAAAAAAAAAAAGGMTPPASAGSSAYNLLTSSGAPTPQPAAAGPVAPIIHTRLSRLLPLQDGSRTAPFPEVLFESLDAVNGTSSLLVAEGYGTLRDATTGIVLYQGLWRNGMRHGKGKSAMFECDGHGGSGIAGNCSSCGSGVCGGRGGHGRRGSHGGHAPDGVDLPAIASGVGAGRYVSSSFSTGGAPASAVAAAAASSLLSTATASSSYFRYIGEYSGDFYCGLRHGQGTFVAEGGDKYDGQWHADYKQGTGTETVLGGGVYKGCWWRGQRHGCGVFSFPSGGAGGSMRVEHREYQNGTIVSSYSQPQPATPATAEGPILSPATLMTSPAFQQQMAMAMAMMMAANTTAQQQAAAATPFGKAGSGGLSRTSSLQSALHQLPSTVSEVPVTAGVPSAVGASAPLAVPSSVKDAGSAATGASASTSVSTAVSLHQLRHKRMQLKSKHKRRLKQRRWLW
jgi:hypothetical protein